MAFNAPSLAKFGPHGGRGRRRRLRQLGDPRASRALRPGVQGGRACPSPSIAADLGKTIVKNIVALGALQAATRLFPRETFLTAIRQALADKCALIPLNEEAFAWGAKTAAEAGEGGRVRRTPDDPAAGGGEARPRPARHPAEPRCATC